MTHTYALLLVSKVVFDEIETLLRAAGYGDVITERNGQKIVDMHGIALVHAEP